MKPFTERLSDKCVALALRPSGPDWTLPILLASDIHFDSAHCDRALFQRHLEYVAERDGRVFLLGDFWDAMQGRSDRRGSKSAVLPQYVRSDYLNALVEDAVGFLEPFAPYIAGWARGNHETAILKYAEFDLLTATVTELNLRTGSQILPMGYTGWIFLRYQDNRGQTQSTRKIYYSHGSGGSAPVTKGIIQANRRAVFLPDADFVVSGHIHQSYMAEQRRERINQIGHIHYDTQYYLQLPTYKDEFGGDGDGWWHEKGQDPRPMGGWVLDLSRTKVNRAWNFLATPRRIE